METSRPLIITPTFNERENIESFSHAVRDILPTADLLIVDDASPDGTGKQVEHMIRQDARIHLLHRRRKEGLGRAYVAGFSWALEHPYSHILQMDADFSHDPKDLPRLLQAANAFDVVIGSRYIGGVRILNWPLRRLILSYAAGIYVRTLTRMPIMDPTGGYKCFRRDVLEAINLTHIAADGYGFQIEMNYVAWRLGFRLHEEPIIFADRIAGFSKMSLAIAWEAIWLVLKLAFIRKKSKHCCS